MAIHIREKPPLRQHIALWTPSGRYYRWADDEPRAENVFSGLRYSDTMPGGHESLDCVLPRKPEVDYGDIERLSTLRVIGAGGRVAGEFRLQSAASTSGDDSSIGPDAAGWQAALEDDESARMVYRDIDLTNWGDTSTARRIAQTQGGGQAEVAPDDGGNAALWMRWSRLAGSDANNRVESWYRSPVELGEVYIGWDARSSIVSDAAWQHTLHAAASDSALSETLSTDPNGLDLAAASYAVAAGRRFLALVGTYTGAFTGDGAWDGFWFDPAVYGRHGLTKRGTEPDAGFLASDIVDHAVRTWAPVLRIKPGSIQQSSFVIPHLVFTEPTTAAEIVRQASRFELPDWAVWDDLEFVWHAEGARGRTWYLRSGPTELSATGPQIDRLWESILVQWTDVDGTTRIAGPPGSGFDVESADLKDSDPENPANKRGLKRRDLLVTGTGTAAGAIAVGKRFLDLAKRLDTSGQAKVVGWAEDDRGVLHPYYAIRSGDKAVFVDAADKSPRKIVRTEKDYATRSCQIDLDAPPEGLQQLLERLAVVLVRLGLG